MASNIFIAFIRRINVTWCKCSVTQLRTHNIKTIYYWNNSGHHSRLKNIRQNRHKMQTSLISVQNKFKPWKKNARFGQIWVFKIQQFHVYKRSITQKQVQMYSSERQYQVIHSSDEKDFPHFHCNSHVVNLKRLVHVSPFHVNPSVSSVWEDLAQLGAD